MKAEERRQKRERERARETERERQRERERERGPKKPRKEETNCSRGFGVEWKVTGSAAGAQASVRC